MRNFFWIMIKRVPWYPWFVLHCAFKYSIKTLEEGRNALFFHSIFYLSLATSLKNMFQEYFSHFSCTEKLFWLFFGIYHHNRSILLTWKSNIIFISLLFLYHMLYLSITNRYLTKRPENKKNDTQKVRIIVIDFLGR